MNSSYRNSIRHDPNTRQARPLQWTSQTIQKFWDYQATRPDTYFTAQFGLQIVRAIQDFVPPGARVLDYACGTGALTGNLLDCGFSVAASDLSIDSLSVVEKQFGMRQRFLGAFPTGDLPGSGIRFDAVVLVELIEHVSDDELERIFDDVGRMLEPGGVVIVTCPNDEDLAVETVYCPCCDHTFHRWQHVRSWSAATLADFFTAQGLSSISMEVLDFSVSSADSRLRFWAKRLVGALRRRRPPHLMAVARKLPVGA